ncbi:hypothetical protein ATI61_103520 [Archangium gephyra]|uniref:Immunity protein 52 domain-containing protein n=1 Tax=Archangium gephyra TaxID=48 RepID=A0ABX9K6V0_9BACT|nr:DUF5953 family protein [Archangium gephyra]REG34614.1 hypothetical protein ATI61_103520 [Archangium gephyra]
MSAEQKSLNVVVYAPALVGDEKRPLAIAQGMERALRGLRLEWTTSEKDGLIALPNRDEGIVTDKANGGFFFLCNDDENHPVTLSGWENPDGLAAGGPPHFQVSVSLPLDAVGIAAAVDVLEAVGDGARAVWGKASLDGYGGVVAQQFRRQGDKPHVPPYGLPSLKRPRDNPAPEIPHYLGWLNYWSAATARAIGFPDPVRDAELLSRARLTATGGWVVWLTDMPLDLDNPAHLDTLKRAYARFPEIGGRSTP